MSETTIILGVSACLVLLPATLAFVAIKCSKLTAKDHEWIAEQDALHQSIMDDFEERRAEINRVHKAMKILPCAPVTCFCKGEECCNVKASKA